MDAKEKILALHSRGIMLGLERMKRACGMLGNPERSFTSIHVAGTVGKGSTSSFLASILQEAGNRVGLYLSPHIYRYNERMQVNGKKISDKEIEGIYGRISRLPVKLTFFEFTTLMAFLHYAKKKCSFAVLEAGLGGRLDATRVAEGRYCIITRIDFDHAQILGGTLAKIAREKCGLIRKGGTVITIRQKGEVMQVIKKECAKKGAKLIIAKPLPKEIALGLNGSFQRENASLAYAFAREIGIGEKGIRKGLKKAFIPARMEFLKGKHRVLLDSAHNPTGVWALARELKKIPHARLIVIFAAMKDKEYEKEIWRLAREADVFICTQVSIERSENHAKLYEIAKKYCKNPLAVKDARIALPIAKSLAKKKDLILVAGSIYLISEIFGKKEEVMGM